MVKWVLTAILALGLVGCGTAPLTATSASTELSDVAAQQDVLKYKDVRSLCEGVLKAQTDAKANKTNVARLMVAVDHGHTLAQKEHNKKAAAIATEALDVHHQLNQQVTSNLSSKLAEQMKANLIDALREMLATT